MGDSEFLPQQTSALIVPESSKAWPAWILPLFLIFPDSDKIRHVVHLHGFVADKRDNGPLSIAVKIDVAQAAQRQQLSGFDFSVGPQKLDPRKTGADHEKNVAILHELPAWLCMEQADRSGDVGQIVWQLFLAQKRFCNSCS